MLQQPLADLPAWTARLAAARIPVQAVTADDLALLAQAEAVRGDVDAHQLSPTVSRDPLAALRLLASAAQMRQQRRVDDNYGGPETVTAALVMMGIGPFFREFESPQTVEQLLGEKPLALAGLQRVIRRAHRAADFALGFAVQRMDDDAAVLQLAALLHDFAEMLLWCHAPGLALQIQAQQMADPALRSAAAQRTVLGIELPALQHALMQQWALPELLVRISDDSQGDDLQVQNVQLAIRLARHTEDPALGWQNPAVPDDLKAIAELLGFSYAATETLVRDIDA